MLLIAAKDATSGIQCIAAALFTFALVPQVLSGQAPTDPTIQSGVQAQAGAFAVYDDNIFWKPLSTSDLVWRLSPAIAARHASTRFSVSSSCAFDADRFQNDTALSTPLARLTSSAEASVKATPRTTFLLGIGYSNTVTPADLNVTTGLAGGRYRASEWHGGPEVNRVVTPHATLGAQYRFRGEFGSSDIKTQEVGMWLAQKLSPRNEIRLKSSSERFAFDSGATIGSETVTVGLARRISDAVSVNAEGGGRYTSGSVRPEVSASLVQHANRHEVTLGFAVDHATAVGVPALIEVRRAQGEVAYHPSTSTRAAVQGAVFVNTTGTSSARVYGFRGRS